MWENVMASSNEMRTRHNRTNHRDVLGEDFTGTFIGKILSINILKTRKEFLTLEVGAETYYIKRPKNKTWHNKNKGDTFVISKFYTPNNIASLYAGETYKNNEGTKEISTMSIYDFFNPDKTKPYIVGMKIMDNESDHYIVYHQRKTYRVPKDFKFVNSYKLNIEKGIKYYVDISSYSTREVPILGLNYNDARKRYLEIHEQSKDELKTFEAEPVSKDKYIDYHKISNIELVNRKFRGLLLIQPIELTTSMVEDELRRYITAKINDKDIVQLKISKHGLWNTINGKDALVVRKRIDLADDGKDLAKLTILQQSSNFKNIQTIDLDGLLKHKHGTKIYVDFDVVYMNDDYICVYADDEVYKISLDHVGDRLIEYIRHGNLMYRIYKDTRNGCNVISTRKTQTRSFCNA